MLKLSKETMFPDSGGFTVYTAKWDRAVGKGCSKHAAVKDWIANSDYTVRVYTVEWTGLDGCEYTQDFADYDAAAELFDKTDRDKFPMIVGYSDDTMFAETVVLADSRDWC